MPDATGLFTIDALEVEQTIAEREKRGWRIFRLPASISSKDDFFEAVRDTLPLEPPLQSNRSWDALSDSLWAGLDRLPDGKIVIVWPEALAMKTHAVQDFDIATDILAELPKSLSNVGITAGATKELLVLQVV